MFTLRSIYFTTAAIFSTVVQMAITSVNQFCRYGFMRTISSPNLLREKKIKTLKKEELKVKIKQENY